MTSVELSATTGTYEKHDSFVEMRHRNLLSRDLSERIRRLQEELIRLKLDQGQRVLLKKACGELLGDTSGTAGYPPFSLQSYVIEEINGLDDSELARYIPYRYRYEIFPQRKILDDFPPLLQIEPASVCNYRCVFCYQTDKEFTRKSSGHMGMMSLDLFKRLIDESVDQCEAITLASRGEPLICPEITDMLGYVGGKFLALKLNTNAWFLDEKISHAILQADINTLVFSVDAASEPEYSRMGVGGKLDQVVENIKCFRDIRAQDYPKSRIITRVSGVKVPGTPELDQMESFWGELVDQVAFVKYNPWEDTYHQAVNKISIPCSDLWRRMFVWWDGTVNPCDVDYKSTLAVGKATNQKLSDLWQSEFYMELRAQHLAGQRAQCSPCNRCSVI